MKIDIHSSVGKKIDSIDLNEKIFKIDMNASVVRQAVLSELTNLRQGTHSSKNRSSVRGGGKKPWKQKGRGVARAGTIRSPLWKGGGTVFGPEPHGYSQKLPKKMSKLARKSVLSKKILDNELIVLDNIDIDSKKTSDFILFMKNIQIEATWKQQFALKEFSDPSNFKSYDALKARYEKVVFGTGNTATADKIETPTVNDEESAPVVKSETKPSSAPTKSFDDSGDDDTMDYFSKLVEED